MKQRGRKSATSLSVAKVEPIPRAAPPQDLAAYEAEVWMSVVNTKPADWFAADTLPMLRSYVRHCYQAKKIDDEMDKIIGRPFLAEAAEDDKGLPLYLGDLFEKLQKMRERESAKIMALARSMRLTQQSQIDPERAHTKSKKSNRSELWEFE
jgi:hypothetical protein